jgi:hypothetical protein
MNIALCFCVRDCGKYLPDIFKNIELVKTLDLNVFSVFIYDNCTDNSQILLEEYQQKNSETVIIRNIVNTSKHRTERIAKARNTCLEIVYNELKYISYHIMIDCDNVCSPTWNIDIIDKYLNNFDNDNWDCISFNRDYYYDIWALLYDDFKHHCWGFGKNIGNKSNNVLSVMKNDITNKLKNCEMNSIEVMSAFNGFCIYKTERFKGLYYDGLYRNVKDLITEEERLNTINKFKTYNLDLELHNNEECCEHIFYHLNALKKGCKIKISKFKVV